MVTQVPCMSEQIPCRADESSPRPKQRNKYVSQACIECKRRKLRCDGKEPCRRCLTGRNRSCTYAASRKHPPRDLRMLSYASLTLPQAIACTRNETFLDYYPTPLHIPMVQFNDLLPAQIPELGLRHLPLCLDADTACPQLSTPAMFDHSEASPYGPDCESISFVRTVNAGPIDSSLPQLYSEENRWSDTGQQQSSVHKFSSAYTLSRLYPNQKTSCLLKCWFDELETYYPCVDRIDFYDRLSDLFVAHCECRDSMTRIPTKPQHIYLAALACGMMSLAAYFGANIESSRQQEEEDEHCRAVSTSWYFESRKLLECLQTTTYEPNLDFLRLQIVYVLYMTIHADPYGMCRSMAIAVDLAFALKLNDESSWTTSSARDKEYRRLLWWTVYSMDRRVALRFGRSILIYDTSFDVGDFSTESKAIYEDAHSSASGSTPVANRQLLVLRWESPSALTSEWFDYLLFITRWSRLVSQVWDKVLSLRALKRPDIAMLAEADERLIQLQRKLPATLFWNSQQLPQSIGQGRSDTMFRLQLISFEMINCLRLCLRTRSINDQLKQHDVAAQRSPRITEAIAANTIDSIVRYLGARKHARPWVTYAGIRIVEVSHDIARIIKSQEVEPTETTYKVVMSISWARRCLENMNMKASYVAAGKLATVLRDVTGVVNTRVPKLISFSGEENLWRSHDVDERHKSSEAVIRNLDELSWLDGAGDGLSTSLASDFW